MTAHPQSAPSFARLDRSETGLGRLARSLLRHRKVVGLFWLVVVVVGIALVGPIAGRLTSSEALPGLPSYQAGLAIMHTYGNGGDNAPTVAVVTLPGTERVDSPVGRAALSTTFGGLRSQRSLRVVSYPTVNDPRLISPSGRAALGLVFAGNDPPTSAELAGWPSSRATTATGMA
jgi:putative drug exporter of the RND superfamily